MQDFLKDRQVFTPNESTMVSPGATSAAKGNNGPFARIVRGETVLPPRAAAPVATKSGTPANFTAPAAHTSQVKTVVENGRIARLIVTCSCGKVTEVACVY